MEELHLSVVRLLLVQSAVLLGCYVFMISGQTSMAGSQPAISRPDVGF